MAGMHFDNDEWNKVKWLFQSERIVKIKAKHHNEEKWDVVDAVKVDGKYYSIPNMNEYHTPVEI